MLLHHKLDRSLNKNSMANVQLLYNGNEACSPVERDRRHVIVEAPLVGF